MVPSSVAIRSCQSTGSRHVLYDLVLLLERSCPELFVHKVRGCLGKAQALSISCSNYPCHTDTITVPSHFRPRCDVAKKTLQHVPGRSGYAITLVGREDSAYMYDTTGSSSKAQGPKKPQNTLREPYISRNDDHSYVLFKILAVTKESR